MGRLVKAYELDVGEYTGRIPVATTDTRPEHPEDGQILFNSTLNMVEVFRNGNWEQAAIVGNTTIAKDSFMGDGSSTTFSPLSYYYYPFDAKQVLVFVENVYQEPDVAYTLHENQIIFADPIPNGLNIIILHGYATVGSNPNTSALQSLYIPLLTSLVPEISASQPTYTRANTATFTDHEGWVRQASADEARFMGMRRVQNLLTDSEDFNDVSWVKTNSGTGTTPVLTSGFTDPLSGSTAWRLQLDKGVGGTSGDLSTLIGGVTSTVGRDYTRSIWMKSNTGGNQIVRLRESNASTVDVEVTTTWQRFSATATSVATASTVETSMEILTRGDLVTTQTVDILIWHPQVEDVTGQTNQAPADYVSVQVLSWPYHGAGVDGTKYFDTDNGNFVSNVYVTEQAGNVITAPVFQGMKFEPVRENLLLYSNDFGNGWTNTTLVTANATVGPDGTTSGDLLTANGSINDVSQQSVTLTANVAYTVSGFFKASDSAQSILALYENGVGYKGYLRFDWANSIPSTNFTLGTVNNELYEEYRDGWWRISFNTTSGTTTPTHAVYVVPDSSVGNASIYATNMQLEQADTLTTYIPTVNTTILRGQDLYTIASADNMYDDQGTAYAEFTYDHTNIQFKNARIIGSITDAQAPVNFGYDSIPIQSYDGVNGTVTPVVDPIPVGAMIRAAATWNDSIDVLKAATQSLVGNASAYDGTMAPSSAISIGYGNGASGQMIGTIRNVRVWRKYLTDDKLALVVGHPFALLLEDGSLLLLQDGNYVLIT